MRLHVTIGGKQPSVGFRSQIKCPIMLHETLVSDEDK